ncbi:LytR/AlgR family response regulator transcription factor [Paraflavitalea pollutisoli]|uniref:LytR/AlgR family response regulator transcription factor n=1 Tax=Paraflavitalea pollutisoli TaxID=3034143 RepID=UPI0023ED2885|nr:LytTR family DNA-binding domain-containing protein [Paraflavitalea sp. H1-2-19X]
MEHTIKCLIVDDEPLAGDVVEQYIRQLDTLSLEGRCNNALEAFHFLQQHKVDIMLLDIQMPRLTGIDLLRSLPKRPAVIITTAYRDYAVEGFELEVIHYLVKPIPFNRFLAAIHKYYQLPAIPTGHGTPTAPPASGTLPALITGTGPALAPDPFIYLKADKKMVKVLLKDILYMESLRDYVRVKTADKDIITYQRITYLEEKLPDELFLRNHRSYIIAIDKIRAFTAATIEIGTEELPIGRQ